MPSKKRKYEARFPPARIKKIMQTDEEIGKVAAAVPVIISRSLEIFLQSLVETTASYTSERKAKTMTTAHLKHCIEEEKKFDFLKDLVSNIADISSKEEEEGGDSLPDKPKKPRKPRSTSTTSERKKRKKESSEEDDDSEASSDNEETVVASTINLPAISSMTSSVPSAAQQSSHSIDAIMGNTKTPALNKPIAIPPPQLNKPLPVPNVLPSFNTLHPNFSSLPVPMAVPSAPIQMNMMNQNDDEDDDYDA